MQIDAAFIDNLPKLPEKVIDGYSIQISNEIALEAKSVGIEKARQNANIKYGKFWRERLAVKKLYTPKSKIN